MEHVAALVPQIVDPHHVGAVMAQRLGNNVKCVAVKPPAVAATMIKSAQRHVICIPLGKGNRINIRIQKSVKLHGVHGTDAVNAKFLGNFRKHQFSSGITRNNLTDNLHVLVEDINSPRTPVFRRLLFAVQVEAVAAGPFVHTEAFRRDVLQLVTPQTRGITEFYHIAENQDVLFLSAHRIISAACEICALAHGDNRVQIDAPAAIELGKCASRRLDR